MSVRITGKCCVFARVNYAFIRNDTKYGLVNPLSLGWELIPFSFVVDWCMPIGNFLEALTAHYGLTFDSGFTSVTCRGSVSGTRKVSNAIGTANGIRYDFLSNNRTALGNFPMPRVYAKNPFKTSNVMSALALFHQLLR